METLTIHTSILVVTKDGVLIRLRCPFKVQVVSFIKTMTVGEVVPVDAVHMGEVTLIYVIADHHYNAHYFVILLK